MRDRNTTLRPGAYRIQSANVGALVLTIRGSNIDLDLSGVERDLRLQGNEVNRNWKQRLPEGLMARRFASINDAPIREDERRILAPGDQALPAGPNR